MSALSRIGARLSGARTVPKLSALAQNTRALPRGISWMAFEQPDPSLYPPPASLQPKRPVAAEAATGTNEVTMVGRVGATPTTARTAPQDTQTSGGKAMPASVPTSAMRTGPTPLSQTQKRPMTTFTSSQQPQQHGSQVKKPESDPAVSKPGGELSPAAPQGQSAPAEDNNGFPTLQVRMAGHPATFPPIGPVYPYDQHYGDEDNED